MFKGELEAVKSESPHQLDIEFLELGEHVQPAVLRTKLQAKINALTGCDAILLVYGLCGTATAGLTSRDVPIIIPRSHDCCGILLGSRKRFEEIFRPMPSTPFASVGFATYGDYFSDSESTRGNPYTRLVEQYSEEEANYIWETMHPRLNGQLQPIYYIHTIPAPAIVEECRRAALSAGREFRELNGDLRLIRMLLSGNWTDKEFLIVRPGESIRQTNDWEQIFSANSGR